MSPRQLAQLRSRDVSVLKSVPKRKIGGLRSMEINTVLDLLTHYPRRWVDRTNQASISELFEGDEAVVTADVVKTSSRRLRNGKSLAEIVVSDGTGSLVCTFFNQAWQARRFSAGQTVTVFGKLGFYGGRRQMANPVVDLVGDQTGRIVSIYPQSGKANISSLELSRYVHEALDRAKELADPVPATMRSSLDLVDRTEAFNEIHEPDSMEAKDRARHRLKFDELLRLQVLLVARHRASAESSNGIAHEIDGELLGRFSDRLPFRLTAAQEAAIADIREDLSSKHPMNRLLQGDVGAGKTVVALSALLVGVEGGYQGAFMVPTEVLAEQHHLSARQLLGGLTVPAESRIGDERPLLVDLLTSRTPGAERARILRELASGELDIVIGTHALLSEGVEFSRLGVVVVDEQHRFGVEQRAALREKASLDPDLLVMTATPIPRTAAMTVYGDLDHTTLDELPSGRSPIETRWLPGAAEEKAAWKRVRSEVEASRQAYVVCPLVGLGGADEEAPDDPDSPEELTGEEPSGGDRLLALPDVADWPDRKDRAPSRSAVDQFGALGDGPLAGLRLGLLHGQMASKDKEAAMAGFRAGETDVLVATTVVEVGVDVANATVMVILDADRFGIAQLHQLRGRVGRSTHRSWCYLVTAGDVTENAESRLRAMVRTQNGFELADEDLRIRGGGTVLGARQKGRTDLKLTNLSEDRDLVLLARQVATEILEEDPELSGTYEPLRQELDGLMTEEEKAFLFRG